MGWGWGFAVSKKRGGWPPRAPPLDLPLVATEIKTMNELK